MVKDTHKCTVCHKVATKYCRELGHLADCLECGQHFNYFHGCVEHPFEEGLNWHINKNNASKMDFAEVVRLIDKAQQQVEAEKAAAKGKAPTLTKKQREDQKRFGGVEGGINSLEPVKAKKGKKAAALPPDSQTRGYFSARALELVREWIPNHRRPAEFPVGGVRALGAQKQNGADV